MGLGTLALMGILWAPGQAAPMEIRPMNASKIDIPITFDAKQKDQIQDLFLMVSEDQGKTWHQYQAAKPDRDQFFTFNAPHDGLYWFQLMIVDKQGKNDPPKIDKPAFCVLIDTKSPAITIKSAERVGDEVAIAWDIQETKRVLKISRHPISLDRPVGESEDSYFGDFIEDESAESPVSAATQEMLKDKIESVLKTLTYREREIIKLRYGLGDGYTYTLEEVGRIFKVTRERVRQIEAKAVRKLQHPVRSRQLEGFLDGSGPKN